MEPCRDLLECTPLFCIMIYTTGCKIFETRHLICIRQQLIVHVTAICHRCWGLYFFSFIVRTTPAPSFVVRCYHELYLPRAPPTLPTNARGVPLKQPNKQNTYHVGLRTTTAILLYGRRRLSRRLNCDICGWLILTSTPPHL